MSIMSYASCMICILTLLQVVIEVVDRKARPEVPSPDKLQGGGLCMHEQYLDLMQQCWSTEAEARPGFDVIIARLRWALHLGTRHSASVPHFWHLLLL